jgi:hypothetical protein
MRAAIMNNANGMRLSVLGATLVATVIASFYPMTENQFGVTPTEPEDGRKTAAFSINAPTEAPINITEDKINDPFARRQWVTPFSTPPVAMSQPISVEVQTVLPMLPPPTPIMPYRYAGRLADGSDIVLYLSRSDQIFAVRAGDVIEGQYKVISIEERLVKLQRLESGELQSLALPSTEN